MAELTPQDVKNVTDQINAYSDEVDKIAKDNGIDVKIKGNDPAELAKGTATGAATGAAVGAAIAPAAGPFAPFVFAGSVIIGAIAGFFSSLHLGPSPEAIALSKEFDGLNQKIHEILLKVPEPYRTQIALIIINAMKKKPGPLPFCLEGGGCAMTSIVGVRDAAAGLSDQIQAYLAQAQARQAAPAAIVTPRRVGYAILGLGLAAGLVYVIREKRK